MLKRVLKIICNFFNPIYGLNVNEISLEKILEIQRNANKVNIILIAISGIFSVTTLVLILIFKVFKVSFGI
ncbi:hypothetical protein EG339_02970 [Chryseobacterium bernardetii]|uniref:Uncharacterized protein n=1 Tax=Chryseobacterium bernardetii TaxID=1241978 RepID=A0A3G6T2I7_9FLAO|nr:hypothetical protein [Chryseobacterium bernardetii]AZB23655.1 hypothetical protein EG339_02970 [Chryseobacterium bernardetii]